MAETATASVTSLSAETGDGLTLESVLGDEGMEDALVEQLDLRAAIARLPERERTVIDLRYFRAFTQERTARVIGVSQVQVSRIERRAVERLRRMLESRNAVINTVRIISSEAVYHALSDRNF